MNRYQTRGLVKADNRKIVLRQNVELKPQDANDSEVLESNPVQRLTLFQNSKRDYQSAHNFDLPSRNLKIKALEIDSKKFPGLSSINQETNRLDNETSASAYNMLKKHSDK